MLVKEGTEWEIVVHMLSSFPSISLQLDVLAPANVHTHVHL